MKHPALCCTVCLVAATIGCGGGGEGNTSGFKQNTGGAGGGGVISSSGGASHAGGAGPGSGPGAGPGSGGSASSSTSTSTSTSTSAGGGSSCNMVFPQPNGAPTGQDWWNTDVSGYPVDPKSQTYIDSINGGAANNLPLHNDFDTSAQDGIPYDLVDNSVTKVSVTFHYASESDAGPYPIPSTVHIEGGSDHHILLVDTSECKLYELWNSKKQTDGWHAGSGAIFDLTSNALRPDCWTSADAAGLAVYPGLVRYEEVMSGSINHALRFTVNSSQQGWILPARHQAGDNDNTLPPMGLRVRLKSNFDLSGLPMEVQVIGAAMKKYGMIVADNGTSWYVTGAPSPSWNNDNIHQLNQIHGNDFEAVKTGSIETDAMCP